MDAWAAFGYGTETASAGAEIAEDHEGRGTTVEAFVNVRAAGGLADRVEVERAETGLEAVQRFKMRAGAAGPFRQTGSGGLDLD